MLGARMQMAASGSYVPMSLSISQSGLAYCGYTSVGGSCACSTSLTANVTGGRAPFTYAWSEVSGSVTSLGATTNQTLNPSDSGSVNNTVTFQVDVTDSADNTVSDQITVTFKHAYLG